MAMPVAIGLWGSELSQAVMNGSVPEARVTDMATRWVFFSFFFFFFHSPVFSLKLPFTFLLCSILAAWYQMGQDTNFPTPGIGMPPSLTDQHLIVDGRNKSIQQVLLDGAVEGHVLVKNVRGTLPLKSPRMLSIFGYSAKSPDLQSPGSGTLADPFTFGAEPVDPLQFILDFTGTATGAYPVIALNGTLLSGGGSGATAPSNNVSPFEAMKARARTDGTAVFWDLLNAQPLVDPGSDACVVFGNAWAAEGYDRPALRDDYTDGLVLAVARQCNNTIVVLHNAGPRLVDQFVDHPNVTALIFAHLPGQESGPAIAALLYGDANPSGKLPYTVAHNETDYGTLLDPAQPAGMFVNFPQSNFSEGAALDYRRFDALNITPRYPFGFGLSYTSFAYANLSFDAAAALAAGEYPSGRILPGGQADLWDILVTVSARVTNTGPVAGAEVAQLYVAPPTGNVSSKAAPMRLLRGFSKPVLNASMSAQLSFALTRRDLSVWDANAQRWRLLRGLYRVFVGAAVAICRCKGTLLFKRSTGFELVL